MCFCGIIIRFIYIYMQYKIPQNVGIEDKIVGPLTLKQLIILAIGSGISYVLFVILNKFYELNFIEYFVIALPLLLSISFAMIKINNIPLLKFFILLLEFSIKPKKRIWDHRGISSLVSPDLGTSKVTTSNSNNYAAEYEKKTKQAANLKELTHMLDSGGFEHLNKKEHDDLDVIHDEDLVSQAYFGHKKNNSETKNMYWRTKEAHMKMLNIFAKMPITKITKGSVEAMTARQEIQKVKKEVESVATITSARSKRRPRRKSTKPARFNSSVNTLEPLATNKRNKKNKPLIKPKTNSMNMPEHFEFRELDKGEINLDLD